MTAILAVGSSAVLGGVIKWLSLGIVAYCVAFAGYVVMTEISIKTKKNRKANQGQSQTDKPSCVSFQLLRRLCGYFCKPNIKNSPSKRQIHIVLGDGEGLHESQDIFHRTTSEKGQHVIKSGVIQRVMRDFNRFFNSGNFHGVVKPPNDQELSDGK